MSIIISKTYDCPYRKDVCCIILDVLSQATTDKSSKELLNITFNIEVGCYNEAINNATCKNIRTNWNIYFIQIYQCITLRVIKNLDPESDVGSRYLLDNILSGNILPINVGKLQPHELCIDRNIDIMLQTDKQRNEKIIDKVSNLYKCSKCRGSTTSIQDVQLRSLDEGSNTRITCMTCSYVWII